MRTIAKATAGAVAVVAIGLGGFGISAMDTAPAAPVTSQVDEVVGAKPQGGGRGGGTGCSTKNSCANQKGGQDRGRTTPNSNGGPSVQGGRI
ncbi:hypothetical protein ACWIGI_29230 [Nocardia sp. NPDC055321]